MLGAALADVTGCQVVTAVCQAAPVTPPDAVPTTGDWPRLNIEPRFVQYGQTPAYFIALGLGVYTQIFNLKISSLIKYEEDVLHLTSIAISKKPQLLPNPSVELNTQFYHCFQMHLKCSSTYKCCSRNLN